MKQKRDEGEGKGEEGDWRGESNEAGERAQIMSADRVSWETEGGPAPDPLTLTN